MSFQVKQKKHNQIYVYEATSYWDPKKKQSRQKRKYLGVWDEENKKIIPKQTPIHNTPSNISVYSSKSYGDCYFFKELIGKLKLNSILKNNFEKWKDILSLSYSKLKNPSSLRMTKIILEDSCFENLYGISPLTSQQISRLLISLHSIPTSFYEDWIIINDHKVVFYDITSLSSYSTQMPIFEFGYNRDGENLPQVNLGLVVSKKEKIPLYYKLFPGSIKDVSTLTNLNKDLRSFDIKKFEYILDKGFFSLKNIQDMLHNELDFIIPLSKTTKLFRNIIDSEKNNISNLKNVITINEHTYFATEKKVEYHGEKVFAYLFEDSMRKGKETNDFFVNLNRIESTLKSLTLEEEFKEEIPKQFEKYIQANIVNQEVKVIKNVKEINQKLDQVGRFILISTKKHKQIEILEKYRDKDSVEKEFYSLKNYIDGTPLRVHREESLRGLIFINFITLIIRSRVLSVIKENREDKVFKKITVQELFIELGKIKKVTIKGNDYITEISKKQRKIFEYFKIKLPS